MVTLRRTVFSMCMRESCRIAMWPPVCSMGKPHSVLTISPFTTYSVYLCRSECTLMCEARTMCEACLHYGSAAHFPDLSIRCTKRFLEQPTLTG